ncbi:hypothetical protein [Pectobacterium versatile]|uniref:hypothetical protein n=1 Tax=Pectobacterium versatile TaxID=2488639 RepID=UPI001F1FB159|nr:hypothetical protein [Pectobacterium versatile]
MKLIQLDPILTSSTPSDWEYDDKTVSYTYKDDVCLRIECDKNSNPFNEPWVHNFSAPATQNEYVIYYNSSVLRRYKIISVDGGRAFLPMPITPQSAKVKADAEKVARILHYASGNDNAGYDYNDFFKRAKLEL